MDEDDLPPQPEKNEEGFSGELGRTVGGFVWIAVFIAIAAAILYVVTRWL